MFCPFYLSFDANGIGIGIGIWTNQPEAQCSIYGGRQCWLWRHWTFLTINNVCGLVIHSEEYW